METALAICIGIGLSAACGFRIIIPFLLMSLAALTGHITLADDMAWIGSYPALAMFAIASLLEIAVYYIPGLDNLMDSIEIPAAIIAGVILTAAFIPEMSPWLRWSLAAIAGGTAAGSTQLLTSVTRLASTATTGGLGNGLLSTMELGSSLVLSSLALTVPILALLIVFGLLGVSVRRFIKLITHRRKTANATGL